MSRRSCHARTSGRRASSQTSGAYRAVAADAKPMGNLVSDAHLVALMQENEVRTIWTHDRDFRRFAGIEARDPFD